MEIWKDVLGYEGLYRVSNLGNVKSLDKKRWNCLTNTFSTFKERLLKLALDNGYLWVTLCKDKKNKKSSVHRLVAIAFIPNPENKKCVNHKDGIKNNNYPSNLEWCTYSENTIHSYKNCLQVPLKGEKILTSKLKEYEVLEIRNSDLLHRKLSEFYNISQSVISEIKSKKLWKHI